jgi:single-strand DNA-binding protein
MNRVELVGRLTARPELRYTSSNLAYCRFTVAVNRIFKNENGETEADFINCVAWKKSAENACNYLDKGSLVSIEGRIQTGSYTDKDGNKRYTTDVLTENICYLDRKTDNRPEPEYVGPKEERDPFADFGEQVTIDDEFLD